MITKLDKATSVDFDPGDFQMAGWTRHRAVSSSPVQGLDAFTHVNRSVSDFDLETRGSDIWVGKVTVKLGIDRDKSWVVQSKQSNLLLEHEQGHYYISYLVTIAELCPKLLQISKPSSTIPGFARLKLTDSAVRDQFVIELNKELNASLTRVKAIITAYDSKPPRGTDHGAERAGQTIWTNQFWRCLTTGTPLP